MDAGKGLAAMAVYEALLAIHGADWIVEQVGDELLGELAILGLIEEGEVTDSGEAESQEWSENDSANNASQGVGEPMDEE